MNGSNQFKKRILAMSKFGTLTGNTNTLSGTSVINGLAEPRKLHVLQEFTCLFHHLGHLTTSKTNLWIRMATITISQVTMTNNHFCSEMFGFGLLRVEVSVCA